MSASTPNLIKQVNLQCVRSALLELKSATKPQLAEYTSLSVITINALIRYLQETGEVLEDSMTHPGLGRPAMSYKLNEEFCMALIVYTFEKDGQDTAFFVVRNLYGDSVESFTKSISTVLPDSFDTEIASLLKKISRYQADRIWLACHRIRWNDHFFGLRLFDRLPFLRGEKAPLSSAGILGE